MLIILYIWLGFLTIHFLFNIWYAADCAKRNNDGIYIDYINREEFEKESIQIHSETNKNDGE